MNFIIKQLMKRPTLIATASPRALVIAACFLTGALTSPTLQASPQTDAKQASHVAETTDGQWLKHSADGSNAEIMMPAKPRLSERTFRPVADEPFINVKTWQCMADGGQVVFTMSYHDLHKQPKTRREMKQVLDGAVKGTVAHVVGSSDTVEDTKVRIYPGRKFTYEFTLNGQQLKSDAEVYLIGKRQYMLNTIFKQSNYKPELSQKYFETFNPFDPEDSSLAGSGTRDAMDSAADDSQDNGFDGLSLPEGVEPMELK